MLSYRHAFHAGNHADVLKHSVLFALLDYYNQKEKPWWYVDSHAGAGIYDLQGDYARRNGEFIDGIARLWPRDDAPPMVAGYLQRVHALNPDGRLRLYPGSPWCALQCARPEDRLRLFELHGSDHRLLDECFADAGRQVRVEGKDGYAGLKSVLPPLTRRAVVLIDPSYEVKTDYQRTVVALEDCLRRFAAGTYMIWYPLLQRPEVRQFQQALRGLQLTSWLHASLSVRSPSPDGFGMHGSGLFIVNPPWTLPDSLREALPWLVAALGIDEGAHFAMTHEIP
jgi:23S rRNA (adenine2030-N6)-methyltransferase